MNVTVTIDGTDHSIDVDLGSLTLQESCDVEELLGDERFEALIRQRKITPLVLRAIMWTKLRRQFPDLTLEAFDTDDFTATVVDGDDEGTDVDAVGDEGKDLTTPD